MQYKHSCIRQVAILISVAPTSGTHSFKLWVFGLWYSTLGWVVGLQYSSFGLGSPTTVLNFGFGIYSCNLSKI